MILIVFFDVDGVDLGMREDNLFFFEIQFMLIRKKQGMIGPQGEICGDSVRVRDNNRDSFAETENINAKISIWSSRNS